VTSRKKLPADALSAVIDWNPYDNRNAASIETKIVRFRWLVVQAVTLDRTLVEGMCVVGVPER